MIRIFILFFLALSPFNLVFASQDCAPISVAEAFNLQPNSAKTILLVGKVINKRECSPCPPGASCKPCNPYLLLQDDKNSQLEFMVLFSDFDRVKNFDAGGQFRGYVTGLSKTTLYVSGTPKEILQGAYDSEQRCKS